VLPALARKLWAAVRAAAAAEDECGPLVQKPDHSMGDTARMCRNQEGGTALVPGLAAAAAAAPAQRLAVADPALVAAPARFSLPPAAAAGLAGPAVAAAAVAVAAAAVAAAAAVVAVVAAAAPPLGPGSRGAPLLLYLQR